MHWVPPWLGTTYATLLLGFGERPFTVSEAEERTKLGRAKTRLALSRLSSAGWTLRLTRGTYLRVEPVVLFSSLGKGWADDLVGEGFFPCLQAAVGETFNLYRERLLSIALFGSAARRRGGKTSDIDLLVVAEGLGETNAERLAEFEGVQEACSEVRRAQWSLAGEYHLLDAIILSREELKDNSLFLLDLTRDAVLVYDRDGTLAGALADLRRRLAEAGSRRVETASGDWYWELKPGAKVGERISV
ncbi:MAG: nucleotidyltransferase domain-containing protein [Nitrososphaerales archaeon]|nr:nucleotidyltransferase domain-containing protein [Nitrososphaerales archaeon]